jgi:hypothetical protein
MEELSAALVIPSVRAIGFRPHPARVGWKDGVWGTVTGAYLSLNNRCGRPTSPPVSSDRGAFADDAHARVCGHRTHAVGSGIGKTAEFLDFCRDCR